MFIFIQSGNYYLLVLFIIPERKLYYYLFITLFIFTPFYYYRLLFSFFCVTELYNIFLFEENIIHLLIKNTVLRLLVKACKGIMKKKVVILHLYKSKLRICK